MTLRHPIHRGSDPRRNPRVWITQDIFALPIWMTYQHAPAGVPQWDSEAIATFGLLGTILGCSKSRPTFVPFAAGSDIAAAYGFTSSTSFANPVVTVARTLTNTFSGIRPIDAPGSIAALTTALFAWLAPRRDP